MTLGPWSPANRTADRTYVVVAQRHEHQYVGNILTDPWGLTYRAVPFAEGELEKAIEEEREIEASGLRSAKRGPREGLDKLLRSQKLPKTNQPLVLRAKAGEWLRVILINDLLEADEDVRNRRRDGRQRFGPEPAPARLPVEHRDWQGNPDRRTVSTRVSLHPSLLRYNVSSNDGSFVGLNPDTTVAARRQFGDGHGMHSANADGGLGSDVVSRADHSGKRNWREISVVGRPASWLRSLPQTAAWGKCAICMTWATSAITATNGLIGALVVLPEDVEPYAPGSEASDKPDGWTSFAADIRSSNDKSLVAVRNLLVHAGWLAVLCQWQRACPDARCRS